MGNRPGYVKASASQSFTEDEIELLDQIFVRLRRGADVGILMRGPHFANLCRKAQHMRSRIDQIKRERVLSGLSSKEVDEG